MLALLGISAEEWHSVPEGKRRLLLSDLYNSLSRDEVVQAKLVDALINADDTAGIQALRAELMQIAKEAYEELRKPMEGSGGDDRERDHP